MQARESKQSSLKVQGEMQVREALPGNGLATVIVIGLAMMCLQVEIAPEGKMVRQVR